MNVFILLLEKEPLLVSASVIIEGTDNPIDNSIGNYFGIGLSNRNGVSRELPFDVLGMVLSSELIRRELDLDRSTVLIADEHAKVNGCEMEIDKVAKERKEFLEATLEKLRLSNFNVALSSNVAKDTEYAQILSTIKIGERYERLQLADVEWFRKRGVGIKIGWSHPSMRFDERHFDEFYRAVFFGNPIAFIYTQAGRSLDGTPLPPYMHIADKPRLLLKADEDIDYKTDQISKGVRAYFNHLLDLFEKMVYGSVSNPNNTRDNFKARLRNTYGEIFGVRHV